MESDGQSGMKEAQKTSKSGRAHSMKNDTSTTSQSETGRSTSAPLQASNRNCQIQRQEKTSQHASSPCQAKGCSTTKPEKQRRKELLERFDSHNEIDSVGQAWRTVLQHLLLLTFDQVNALRYTRALQLFLPFLTSHEAYTLSQVIETMDRGGNTKELRLVLTHAFRNRNVSRILVQNLGLRYDFLWHWSAMITWNRVFDAWGQLPWIGITGFPATENFPSTRNHALASMFRLLLGPGNWLTRVVTRGRESLITDNPENTAQNLAAESNGFELANRNQFGTYFGRQRLNEFRFAHRLPTDESIVRTFVAQPMPTLVNNGVVHVLRQLSKHWHNMLNQPCGNFSHQRMEQLDPFETLRFHIPEVLLVLASLRGRTEWDSKVMGPMIKKLQALSPCSDADEARKLVRELQATIIGPVCAGIPSVINPFRSWADAIELACDLIEEDATKVYKLVSSVEKGIRIGYDLFTQVTWKVPSDRRLEKMILDHIDGKFLPKPTALRVRSALQLTTPRDKRTLIELVKNNLAETKPAQLLLGRVKTLLQRELRREMLNRRLREMSMGASSLVPVDKEWYWLEEKRAQVGIYVYDRRGSNEVFRRFVNVISGSEKLLARSKSKVKIRPYIAVGETISRAQKAFMTIELEYGSKFTYNAFMEFSYLRELLRRLIVVSQISCEELDNARLNILKETQRCTQLEENVRDLLTGLIYYTFEPETNTYEPFELRKPLSPEDPRRKELEAKTIVKIPPQNIIVVGGGPTGLMAAIHCTENVLVTGGTIRLFEARDAFAKGGSAFERAQIVRLDARWIAMMRYHLGTGFEDVFIPATGETDSQLGNTLPTQGFVEITIKDLESLLHTEVSRLWSKGLLSVCADSKARFDSASHTLVKLGKHLKEKDLILLPKDENGLPSKRYHTWRVAQLIYSQPLGLDDLQIEQDYGVYIRQEKAVLPFKLLEVCLESRTYSFESLTDGVPDLRFNARSLPSIYLKDTETHAHAQALAIECTKLGANGRRLRQELLMKDISEDKFTLDVGNCHIIEAIGKPRDSKTHLRVTTPEPYGVLCMQGLKVSMGMHNFGEKRWGAGLLDDIRSQNDQNTRIIGDFTKMVRLVPIMEKMHEIIAMDKDWIAHFRGILLSSKLQFRIQLTTVVGKLERACKWQVEKSHQFRRQTLQCRFFETGDQFYLGMEFPREYEDWKQRIVDHISSLTQNEPDQDKLDTLKCQLKHHLDRLWYEACLETIRSGDVYNPGARKRVPRLYLINSYHDVPLGDLPVGESFRMCQDTEDRFEILVKTSCEVIVRNVQGLISRLSPTTLVRREGNLTRTPDGNGESKVSIATFPVSHYVNYRTMSMNSQKKGYVSAFIGDEQATPHFMRYSGLTGACINAMLLNRFIREAIDGVPLVQRFATYSSQTHWSSSEVVTRGTGACFGQDGFLRPGFSYDELIDYLYARVVEHDECQQDLGDVLSNDWLFKLAASLIPRGLEMNRDFILTLKLRLRFAIFDRVFGQVKRSWKVGTKAMEWASQHARNTCHDGADWERLLDGAQLSQDMRKKLEQTHIPFAKSLERICNQIIEHAAKAYVFNERISSQLFIQPKPVDSIVDDFAVEAQNFANSLVLAVALSSAALTFRLIGSNAFNVLSGVVSVLNVVISFDTMTNVARYKIRSEEARVAFFEKKLSNLKKAIVGTMASNTLKSIPESLNPFVIELEKLIDRFQKSAVYYNCKQSTKLKRGWQRLKGNIISRKEIRKLQKMLVCELIVDTYHVNSYLQEELVNIYKSLEEALFYIKTRTGKNHDNLQAQALLYHLIQFTTTLETSLQRGSIKWGFIKRRKLAHWNIVELPRFFYSYICTLLGVSGRFATIESVTKHMLNQVKRFATRSSLEATLLHRQVRDLEELYWATHESAIASIIFLSAFLVFVSSLVFTTGRLFRIQTLEQAAFWASVPSTFGAVLAIFHFLRKLCILFDLWRILGQKVKSSSESCCRAEDDDDQKNTTIQMICNLTLIQLLLTFLRLNAATTAAVALPFSIAENGFGTWIDTPMMLPFWIAAIALLQAILATILFFVVEYVVRYNLSPTFPVIIVESFRNEINALYWEFHRPWNDIETKQVQETVTWEYVAREFLHRYRFDTVFAADRFGAILQYIQCGMETEQRSYDDEQPRRDLEG